MVTTVSGIILCRLEARLYRFDTRLALTIAATGVDNLQDCGCQVCANAHGRMGFRLLVARA
eukprot:16020546-Heterocapsa_arctica.AAC.1